MAAAADVRISPTPVSRSLRSNFFWILLANVVFAGSQWGMQIAIARFGTPEMLGQFALGLAVTIPVFMLANANLKVIAATDAKRQHSAGDYLGLRLTTTVIAIAVIVCSLLLSSYDWTTSTVIFAVAMAQAFEAAGDIYYGFFQQHEAMDRVAISMICKGLFSLCALAIVLWLTRSIVLAVMGYAAGRAFVYVLYDAASDVEGCYRLLRSGHSKAPLIMPSWNPGNQLEILRIALPLGVVAMLVTLCTNIPRYFIDGRLGQRELGIFAALGGLLQIQSTIILAFNQAAVPRLAKLLAVGDVTAFRRLVKRLLSLGCIIGAATVVGAVVIGKELLIVLYGSQYATRTDVLVLMAVVALAANLVALLGGGVTAARWFAPQIPILTVTAVTTAVASFILIPPFGLQGAAYALLLGTLVQLAGTILIFKRMITIYTLRSQ